MEIALRISFIYVLILVGLRLAGKREFGQLSPADLVTLLLIPEIVSQAITGDDYSVSNAVLGVVTLLLLVIFTSLVSHRFRRLEEALSGRPAVLVAHGRLLADACNRERVSPEEIMSEVHRSGLESLDAVRWAILEADGRIAIVPR